MDNVFRSGSASENTHKIIYIADLPKNTSYLDLSDFYERNVGPCMICIKRPLFKNFYYAFVQFETIELAKKAATDFRFPTIKGNFMSRVLPYNMHALRGEAGGRDMQSTSVFVKGFEKAKWNHADLYAKFCTYGKILSCKVSISPDHEFLGFGYVQFAKLEEAQKAIQEMDKYDLSSDGPLGCEGILSVLEYQGKRNQGRRSFNNIYVKNFPKEFTDEDLENIFSPFGQVQNAAIMRDGTGDSKCFGFVCFNDSVSAEKVLSLAQMGESKQGAGDCMIDLQREIKGVKITDLYIREAKKKSIREHELMMTNFKYKKSIMFFSLFVKNFPIGTTAEELQIYFQTACQGEVNRVTMIKGTQQAFVNFEKQDQCKLAKEFARNVLFKSQYPLYVEYCYPKEMRTIRNEEIYDQKAQQRKKNQAQQATLASLNGSQNLIDLLTMLLKPAFQLGNTQGSYPQRRAYSSNTAPTQRQSGLQGPSQIQQFGAQNRMANARQNLNQGGVPPQQNNFQRGPMANQMAVRNTSVPGQPMGYFNNQQPFYNEPQPSIPPQQYGQQALPQPAQMSKNMPQVPVVPNVSGQQVSPSSTVDMNYVNSYTQEVFKMFQSTDWKNANKGDKKNIVGNTIYPHVERLVGPQKAPKITGMLIDLPEVELNYSISKWYEFESKVMSAYNLITQNENQQSVPSGAPESAQPN